MKKAIRILIMSVVACFSLTFTLMLINSIMGIFVGLRYYTIIFVALTIGSTMGLVLVDSKRIFSKKKVRKVAVATKVSARENTRSRQARRKIS